MALKVYVKDVPNPKKEVAGALSYIALTIGALLMFWSFYPIISFEIYSRLFIEQSVASPVPRSQIATSIEQASSVLGTYNVFSSNLRDFVDANIWFPSKPQGLVNSDVNVQEYYLSIPKLNIVKAKVIVGSEDLSKSLIHYLPTSLPGEFGNVAIFGHSTLPQLYDVTDYKTIFTYLPSLEKGDKIIIDMQNETYEYEIYDMFVVKPDEVSVLDQRYDASYLTVVTCVPPGTFWNRLIVRAKLKNLPS